MIAVLAAVAGLVTSLAALFGVVLPFLERRRHRALPPAPEARPPDVTETGRHRLRDSAADLTLDATAQAFLADARAARLQKQRVLLVEDNPVMRRVIALIMRSPRFEDVELVEAPTFEAGRAALAGAAGGDPFDVVILDQMLPDGQGWNLIKLIPRTGTALLLMSAHLDDGVMDELATFALGERLDKDALDIGRIEEALLRGLGRA